MGKETRNTTLTCIAGEYYVLAELARRGAIASMTIRNTKGVDILVVSPNGKKMFKAEVKTTYNSPAPKQIFHPRSGRCIEWRMNRKHEGIREKNLIYAFVWLPQAVGGHPRIFLVQSAEVATYVKWQHKFWLRKRKGKDTDMRVFRIPEDKWQMYENNWTLLGCKR